MDLDYEDMPTPPPGTRDYFSGKSVSPARGASSYGSNQATSALAYRSGFGIAIPPEGAGLESGGSEGYSISPA